MKRSLPLAAALAALVLSGSAAATPEQLRDACEAGNLAEVKRLVEAGDSIASRAAYSFSPLVTACLAGQGEVARYLVERGADIRKAETYGWTPLAAAVRGGNDDLVRYLIGKGADPAGEGVLPTPIQEAVLAGDEKMVSYLLERGAPGQTVTRDGVSLLMDACMRGNRNIVESLLAHGADPGYRMAFGRNAMTSACFGGHLEIVRMLHALGEPLYVADQIGGNSLLFAAMSGNRELVEYLLNEARDEQGRPISADRPDIHGCTPLFILTVRSLQKGLDVPMMRLLLERGADPQRTNEDGESPLGWLKDMSAKIVDDLRKGVAPPEIKPLLDDMQSMVSYMEKRVAK